MVTEAIETLKKCKSVNELSKIWETNIPLWSSRLDYDNGLQLVQVKDELKYKLQLFEEWLEWFEERAAIIQYDGKHSRTEADVQAKDCLRNFYIINK